MRHGHLNINFQHIIVVTFGFVMSNVGFYISPFVALVLH
jgi:hypothetical protein